MLIADYVAQARSVAHYHDKAPNANFIYPALGLCGEIGEALDKVQHVDDAEAITGELGDVLWYVVNTALDLDITIPSVIDSIILGGTECQTFDQLQGRFLALDASCFLAFVVYAGRIAEIAKKSIRDTNGSVSDEKVQIIRENLGYILLGITRFADMYSVPLQAVAQANINKLFSRRDRGVLSGDGDNR